MQVGIACDTDKGTTGRMPIKNSETTEKSIHCHGTMLPENESKGGMYF